MKPRAVVRRSPEDFVVEELPAYAPSGAGEHLFVHVRKRNLTTFDAVRRLAHALDVDHRGAGFAGMKDRRAVTTQTLSFPFPIARDVPSAESLGSEGLEILSITRSAGKLKPGHLRGNRFTITLRDLPRDDIPEVARALREAGQRGVPNTFGPQRFGRDGENAERAIACLSGAARAPRDKRELRLLFSALQAELYNRVLSARVEDGTWNTAIAGDLLKKHETGGMFLCADEAADAARAASLELSPTGPIFGAAMRWPEGRPAELERAILERSAAASIFERHRSLGEGSRRSLRLLVDGLCVESVEDDVTALRVGFVLPKGGYATTLLACAVRMDEEERTSEETVSE